MSGKEKMIKTRRIINMAKFSQGFILDDLEDPVDLVLCTDTDFDAAIEKAEELADTYDVEDVIKTMEEAGDISADLTEEDEDMMYDEDEDDAMDIADIEAQDYREAFDVEEEEDMEEDEEIDTVIDADPSVPLEDIEDEDLR